MSEAHKQIVFKQCDKIIRQQGYYQRLARRWEREAVLPETTEERKVELRAKIDTVLHCTRDLQFILDQTRKALTPEEWDSIQQLAQDHQAWIDERHRSELATKPMPTEERTYGEQVQ